MVMTMMMMMMMMMMMGSSIGPPAGPPLGPSLQNLPSDTPFRPSLQTLFADPPFRPSIFLNYFFWVLSACAWARALGHTLGRQNLDDEPGKYEISLTGNMCAHRCGFENP